MEILIFVAVVMWAVLLLLLRFAAGFSWKDAWKAFACYIGALFLVNFVGTRILIALIS